MTTRRGFLIATALGAAALVAGRLSSGIAGAEDDSAGAAEEAQFPSVSKTKAEWKTILSAAQYRVLFEEGTEPPHSSPLNAEKRKGSFLCAACFLPLFDSEAKYESGTGWPSFFRPLAGRLETKTDYKLIFPRTEYHCARCGGHQGHVFDDGPEPTGKRWCNNGVALLFVPDGDELPELRS